MYSRGVHIHGTHLLTLIVLVILRPLGCKGVSDVIVAVNKWYTPPHFDRSDTATTCKGVSDVIVAVNMMVHTSSL